MKSESSCFYLCQRIFKDRHNGAILRHSVSQTKSCWQLNWLTELLSFFVLGIFGKRNDIIPLTFGFKSFFITRIWLNRWDFTKKKLFSPGCLGWMSYTWVCKSVDTWTVLETCWVVHYIICKIELWDYYTCTSLTNNVQLQKNLGQCF